VCSWFVSTCPLGGVSGEEVSFPVTKPRVLVPPQAGGCIIIYTRKVLLGKVVCRKSTGKVITNMTTNQNNVNANQITTPTFVTTWDGNPSTKLEIWRKQILVASGCIIEQGYSLATAILGTHPTGSNYGGPAPNAATQQQAQVRNGRAVAFILTKIEVNSDAYINYSDPMFLNDPELLWADMVTNYVIGPTPEELTKLLKRVDEFKMSDFKPKDYSKLIFEFTTELKARNEDLPNASKRNDPQLAAIFLAGMHPNLFDTASMDAANPAGSRCIFPGVIPPNYPNAGAAHPFANQLSLQMLSRKYHQLFTRKVAAGLIHVPRTVNAHEVDEAFANFERLRVDPCKPPYIKCLRCGGIGHFANQCGTPRDAIPSSDLKLINYDGLSIRQFVPQSKGKGKGGKGKGKGKGGKGYKGKGSANATDFYYWDDNLQEYIQYVAEGTDGMEAGGDGDGDGAVDVSEEHAEAVEGWNPSFIDYWEDDF